MSDAIPVHIVMVLDESGSMAGLADDLIGGVNTFLAEQRSLSGKCRLTLAKFAPFTVIHDAVRIGAVPDLTRADYAPSSSTPLLDAEGQAIAMAIRRETARERAGKRTEAVLFVTYTDGQENASQEWTYQRLTEKKAERTALGWTFLYLGAGHDVYAQSSLIGTFTANASSYAHTPAGMHQMTANTSAVATAYRGAASRGDTKKLAEATHDVYGTFDLDDDDD